MMKTNLDLFRGQRPTRIFWGLYLFLIFPLFLSVLWGLILPGEMQILYSILVTPCATLLFLLIGMVMAVRMSFLEKNLPRSILFSNLLLWVIGLVLMMIASAALLRPSVRELILTSPEALGQTMIMGIMGFFVLVLAGLSTGLTGILAARRAENETAGQMIESK